MKLRLITIICALAFMTTALFTAADIAVYHIPGYYQHQFEENEVQGNLNREIDMQNIMTAFNGILEYLRGNRNTLNNIKIVADSRLQEFYTEREKLHLSDVKRIFLRSYRIRRLYALIFAISSAYLIATGIFYNSKSKAHRPSITASLCRLFVFTCVITNIVFASLIGIISINFDKAFTIFHHLLFKNDYWLLDSNTDDLINLLPESFFIHMALTIVGIYSVIVISVNLIVGVLQKSCCK